MTPADHDLLALAAKAAGKSRAEWDYDWLHANGLEVARDMLWNPLENSGQALELAVKLQLDVMPFGAWVDTELAALVRDAENIVAIEEHNGDPLAATRRAITRAAAAIGAALN